MKQTWKRVVAILLTVAMVFGVMPTVVIWQATAASANETAVYNYLVNDMGLSVAAACGVLANIKAESSFSPTCSYMESGGYESYGICQWNRGRLDNLKTYCASNNYDYKTITGQLHYMEYELNKSYTKWINQIRAVSNTSTGAAESASIWCLHFEIPANKEKEAVKRGEVAVKYFDSYNKTGNNSGNSNTTSNTITSGDGLEYAMFPLATLNISRTNKFLDPDQSNAAKDGGHGGGFAWDLCGGSKDVSAPFTGKIVYIDKSSGGNHCVILKSSNKVHLANGQTDYLSILLCHDNNISNLSSGQVIKQGQVFYQQGDFGQATGVHVHVEIAKGDISFTGKSGDITTMRKSGNRIQVNDALFLTKTTNRVKDYIRVTSKKPAYNITLTWRVLAPISVVATAPTEITNSSAKIWATLSSTISVEKESYVISTRSSDISGKDYTLDANRKWIDDNAFTYGDYIKFQDHSSKLKSINASSCVIKTINGKTLTPGTTYYYKMLIKDGSGVWYSSQMNSFTTLADRPEETTLRIDTDSQDIGLSDTAVVTWAAAKYATAYEVLLYNNAGTQIYSSGDLVSTTYAFPGTCFTEPGEYSAKLIAKNTVGNREADGQPHITVHPDATVTFYDTVAEQIIQSYSVTYGHDAVAPQSPAQYGYTFKGWDCSFAKVKNDTTVKTVYEANSYTVNFVNGMTGEILETQRVRYKESATEPVKAPAYKSGYVFKGWDKDFTCILGDTTIQSVYEWYDVDYPVSTEITKADLNAENTDQSVGYDVEVHISNGKKEAVQGRLVFALKTAEGFLYTNTESSAFSLAAEEEKTVKCFVPSETHAALVEVYTINNYENAGPIAAPKAISANNESENAYSPWSETYPDGEEDVQSRVVNETHTEYQYPTTVQSYETSLPGYRQTGFELEQVGAPQTIKYVMKWPAGFDKSHSLYTTYANNTQKQPSESATTVVTVSSPSTPSAYIYWHWCRGRTLSDGPYNSLIANQKEGDFKKFHAFESTQKPTYNSSAKAIDTKKTHKSDCSDSQFWWYDTSLGSSGTVEIYTQTYTTYRKLYTYELIVGDDEWTTDTPEMRGVTGSNLYSTRVVETEKTEYRYRADTLTFAQPTGGQQTALHELGTIDAEKYGGKAATIFIYKYTQPSDYTTEAAIPTIIRDDGTVWVDSVLVREAQAEGDSDYQIAASVKGYTSSVPVGVIEAPKRQYTVTYYDFDHATILSQSTIEEGGTVTAPSSDLLSLPEGQRFTRWNQSTVGVYANLEVYPESEAKDCVLVFIDWNCQTYELRELKYGDAIVLPALESDQFTESYWNTDGLTPNADADGWVVTGNTVVTSNKVDREITATYLLPGAIEVLNGLLTEADMEGLSMAVVPTVKDMDILDGSQEEIDAAQAEIATQIQDYVEENNVAMTPDQKAALTDALADGVIVEAKGGDAPIRIPELDEGEDAPKYFFYGWKQVSGEDYLTDAVTETDELYIPVYAFAETCITPDVSVATGEYDADQTVSFICDTENAQIWYTIDGTDPHTSATASAYYDEQGNPQPFIISQTTVLTYYASVLTMNDSDMITELYAINKAGGGVEYHIVTIHCDKIGLDEENAFVAMIREGQYLDIPNNISTVEGYMFDGLYYDDSFEDEFFADEEPITETLNLYAKHTAETYTVTFYDFDGRALSTQIVSHGEEADAPTPTREGYVFIGWDGDGYLGVTENGEYTAVYCSEDDYVTIAFKSFTGTAQVGKTMNLSKRLKITPASKIDTQISWHTSNPAVASVDYTGNVTFVGVGTVTITAFAEVSGEYAEKVFEVKPDDTKQIVLSSNSSFGLDSLQFIREAPEQTTVEMARRQFLSGELLKFVKEKSDGTTEVLEETAIIGSGTYVMLLDEDDTVLDCKQIIVTGDYDGDGCITVQDASHLSRYLVEKEDATLWQLVASDCNGDGSVNVRDSSMIIRYTVGKETW